MTLMRAWSRMVGTLLAAAAVMCGAGPTLAQVVGVTFTISQTTSPGTSVYVLGDLAELGGNDLRRAVKLEPSTYPVWRATIALPTGTPYSYRFYTRADGATAQRDPANGTALGSGVISGVTPGVPSGGKAVFYVSGWEPPVLHWRHGVGAAGSGAFTAVTMTRFAPGRSAGEWIWVARNVGQRGRRIEFFVQPTGGTGRDPAVLNYQTPLDAMLVQDGQVYSYRPAGSVGSWRRVDTESVQLAIQSTNMGERRRYRVVLPRGYDQHPTRRYPVVYFHDGQNVFDMGSFGTWNAHVAADAMTRAGLMREAILVGVDNTSNRLRDYQPPGDSLFGAAGWADRYSRFLREELMPVIDAEYRTLTGPTHTAVVGSSMGGLVSMYLGWDWPERFGRIGAMSGAWWTSTNFYNRVRSQPLRPIRVWLDSGDTGGSSNDDYWNTYNLRDNMLNPGRASGVGGAWVLRSGVDHVVGFSQEHNEAAWSQRVDEALAFLMPATEEPSVLLSAAGNLWCDIDGDGRVTIEDVYAQRSGAGARDLDMDGSVTPGDAAVIEAALRGADGLGG